MNRVLIPSLQHILEVLTLKTTLYYCVKKKILELIILSKKKNIHARRTLHRRITKPTNLKHFGVLILIVRQIVFLGLVHWQGPGGLVRRQEGHDPGEGDLPGQAARVKAVRGQRGGRGRFQGERAGKRKRTFSRKKRI